MYKAPCIYCEVVVLILNLAFRTEYSDGVGETLNIFLFSNLSLSLSASSEVALVERRWEMVLDSSMLNTYTNTASLLHHQKVVTIVG